MSSCQSNVFTHIHLHCCSAKQMLNFSRDCMHTHTHRHTLCVAVCPLFQVWFGSSSIPDSSNLKQESLLIFVLFLFCVCLQLLSMLINAAYKPGRVLKELQELEDQSWDCQEETLKAKLGNTHFSPRVSILMLKSQAATPGFHA